MALNSFQSAFTYTVSGEMSPGRCAHTCLFYGWASLLSAKSFCPVPGSSPWGLGPVAAASYGRALGIQALCTFPDLLIRTWALTAPSGGVHATGVWKALISYILSLFLPPPCPPALLSQPLPSFSPLLPFSNYKLWSWFWHVGMRLTWFFVSALLFDKLLFLHSSVKIKFSPIQQIFCHIHFLFNF